MEPAVFVVIRSLDMVESTHAGSGASGICSDSFTGHGGAYTRR